MSSFLKKKKDTVNTAKKAQFASTGHHTKVRDDTARSQMLLQALVKGFSFNTNRSALISVRHIIRPSRVVKVKDSKPEILKNEEIKYPNLRVVFKNEDSGKEEHKLMARLEAINFARSRSLDLILVSSTSDPPVCRLDNAGLKKLTMQKRIKEVKAKVKARELKEIHIGTQIAPHDLETKLGKVREFLGTGHPVKVSFIALPKVFLANPLTLDQIILQVLEMLEKDGCSVQPLLTRSHLRKELIVSQQAKLN